ERLKKELEAERLEAQRLRGLLQIAEDNARNERQEKELLKSEICRLEQTQDRHEESARKVGNFMAKIEGKAA
ncbi:hypothetical protein AAVH_23090, partial [Aphelenchoides avenae]